MALRIGLLEVMGNGRRVQYVADGTQSDDEKSTVIEHTEPGFL